MSTDLEFPTAELSEFLYELDGLPRPRRGEPILLLRDLQVLAAMSRQTGHVRVIRGRKHLNKFLRKSARGVGAKVSALAIRIDDQTDDLEKLEAIVRVARSGQWPNDPQYMLVLDGVVQFYNQPGKQGTLLFFSHDVAQEFAHEAKTKSGKRPTVAKIGSIRGETLDGQLAASVKHGANGAWFVKDLDHLGWYSF